MSLRRRLSLLRRPLEADRLDCLAMRSPIARQHVDDDAFVLDDHIEKSHAESAFPGGSNQTINSRLRWNRVDKQRSPSGRG